MRADDYRQHQGVIALLRQVPRSVWIAAGIAVLLLMAALAWAAVVAVQWLLGQDPALAGQAAAWLGQAGHDVPAVLAQVDAAVPGLVEPVTQAVPGVAAQLDQWVPGSGARLQEAAAALGSSAPEAAEAVEAAEASAE